MSSTSRHPHQLLSTLSFALPALVVSAVVLALALYRLTPENIFFGDDIGTTFSVSRALLNGESVLLGPPSHLGGRHFIPFYYWHMAFALWLTGSTYGACLFDVAIKVAGVFLTLLGLSFYSAGIWRWAACISAALLFLAGQGYETLRLPWHSNFLLFPCGLLYLSACLIDRFGLRYFALFALGSSLSVGTHFSCFPLVAALALILFAGQAKQLIKLRPGQIVLVLLAGLAPWLPTLKYELLYDSNFLSIISHHERLRSDEVGLGTAVEVLAEALRANYVSVDHLLVFIGMAFGCLGTILRPQARRVIFALGAAWLAYLPALAAAPDKPSVFYLHALLLSLPMAVGIAVGQLGTLTGERRAAKVASLVAMLVLCVLFAQETERKVEASGAAPNGYFQSLAYAEELAGIIRAESSGVPHKIIATGDARHSEGAIYYFLGSDWNPLNFYATSMVETASFAKVGALARPQRGYLLTCGAAASEPPAIPGRLAKVWTLGEEVALSSCRRCGYCRAYRISRRRVP